MSARLTLIVVGAIVAVLAVYFVISAIIGLLWWVAVFAVIILVIWAFVKRSTKSARPREVPEKRVKGIVDCTGKKLTVGDTVRPAAAFDGPIELAFGHGTIVKLGRGRAHVRFDEDPERLHPITPTTLRWTGRLG